MVVDSKEQMLPPDQIILIGSEQTKSEIPDEMVIAMFYKEAQMPGNRMLRYGNTIFVIDENEKKPGTGMFRALNADTAPNFLESSFQFIDKAYEMGFWFLVTQFRDQSLINIFRTIAKNPPREQMGYKVQMTGDGGYQVSLQLGPPLDKKQAGALESASMQTAAEPSPLSQQMRAEGEMQ